MRSAALWLLVPALVAFAVYAATLDGEFVYDDTAQIVHNPWVRELRHLPQALTRPVWAFQTPIPTNYFRPFQMGAYNLMWAASGGSPLPFHLVNVLLHAGTTALLAAFVRRLSGDRFVGFAAALLFAVHPLNSEAVAWIACLPELGYAAFGLAALLLHTLAWDAPRPRRSWLRAGEVVAFALAMLAKETAVVVPVLVLLLEIGLRRRRWQALKACVPYAVVLALYAAFRLQAIGGVAPLARTGMTAWDAVLNAPSLLLGYVGKMVWPVPLVAYHVFEPVRGVSDPRFYLAVLATLGLAALAVWIARRRVELGIAAALVALPLVPVLYVPAVGLNVFAERYAYLPLAGFTWLVAAGLSTARTRAPAVGAVVLALLCVPAAAHAVSRSRAWHDDERLAETTLRQSPDSRIMWSLLAGTYRATDRPEQAVATLESALERFPQDPFLRADLIGTRLITRDIAPDEAVRHLEEIVAQGWVVSDMWVYLGKAHQMRGDSAAAEQAYRKAIALNQSSRPAYHGLALALMAQGKTAVDVSELLGAAGFEVGGELDRLILAAAQLKSGDLAVAERLYRDTLQAYPGSPGAQLGLGQIAARRQDHAAAIDHCRRALAVAPDLVDAHQQLGMSAMALGRMDEAVRAFQEAVALSPYDKAAHNRLGVALARAGRADEARRAWQRALEIDPAYEGARHNLARLETGG